MKLSRRMFFGIPVIGGAALFGASREPAAGETPQSKGRPSLVSAAWKSPYDRQDVWGFADRHSVEAGGTFDLMLSTGPTLKKKRGVVEIFRAGAEPEDQMPLVWRSEPIEVMAWEIQATSASIGADWPPAIRGIQTDGWKSGYYSVHFLGADGLRDSNIAYIIVLNPRRDAEILVVLGTNTYNAYNSWGGYSLYESAFTGNRGQMLSFDRPPSPDFFSYDVFLVSFLEQLSRDQGFRVDYASNWDIHRDPPLTSRYKLLISAAHNEYMSDQEFDALWQRIFKAGKSTMFLGANAAYWRIRYADLHQPPGGEFRARQMICFKVKNDPIALREGGSDLATDLFRATNRPETMLMGNAFQSYFEPGTGRNGPHFPYRVVRNDLPFFEGTGLKPGDALGDVVGYEWDNTDPDGDGRRLWNENSAIPELDRKSVHVLFEGRPIDASGKRGRAEAVYFKSNAGAHVFSAGSTRWSWGLSKPGFLSSSFQRLNANMIRYFLS